MQQACQGQAYQSDRTGGGGGELFLSGLFVPSKSAADWSLSIGKVGGLTEPHGPPLFLAFPLAARYLEVQLSPVRGRPLRKRLMAPGAVTSHGPTQPQAALF